MFWVSISSAVNVECDPARQFMCADQAKCVDIQVLFAVGVRGGGGKRELVGGN